MANFNVFWYEGPATGNQRISGLTAEQALDLQKQEDEMKKAEAAKMAAQQADADYNMKAGPALNQEIAGYLKDNPTARPMQAIQSGSIKTDQAAPQSSASQFALGSDSFNKNLSDFASKLQNESSLSGIPATGEGTGMQQQTKPAIDTETAYNGMLKGIPVEIAQDLIFQYHNGLIDPKKFIAQVAAVKKSLFDVKVEDEKADRASQRKIREQGMQSQGEIDKQYVTNEGTLDLANVNNAASLQRQREENISQEKIAQIGNKDKEDKTTFEKEYKLRSQYNSLSKDYRIVKDAVAKVNEAAKLKNASGDMSLIYGFMRIQDPTSTVREGEFATAEKARGIPESILNLYNKAVKGTRLSDRQRNEFANTISSQYKIVERNQEALTNQFKDIALSYGLDPDRVIGGTVNPQTGTNSVPDVPTAPKVPTPATVNVVSIKTEDEYNKLQPGTPYIGPDGKKRIKR